MNSSTTSRTSGQQADVAPPPGATRRGGGGHQTTMSTVETAHSTLFFVSDRVFKMPKRAAVGKADLRRREAREEACRAEIVRNRPFAPGVYLGVADVRDSAGAPVEHMVVMRRLPSERRLSELLARGEPVDEPLREVARALVTFHEQCETSAEIAEHGRLRDLEAAWLAAIEGLTPFQATMLDAAEIAEIDELGQRYLRGRRPLIDGRAARGRIRDGHGNLLAEHVFCLDDGPRILDRLSADDGRRIADVLADASMLAVDLELRGAPQLTGPFFRWFVEFAGETHPPSLTHFYMAHRAILLAGESAVRAHLGDETAAGEARRLVRIALEHLRRARVRLVLVGGAPGSVRAAFAERLIQDEDGWVLLASDAIRGELAVERELVPPGAGARREGPADADAEAASDSGPAREFGSDDEVHAELLRRAREALERGDSVIVQARWSEAEARKEAAAVAARTWSDLIELDSFDARLSLDKAVRDGRLALGIAS
ncbi:hypothetical protein CcI49_27920 [Frankia sp. CcI49]|uniref:AAA family ATPase n=1 Tax=Frankia sp. CcI49 TaxID=1745382 RepID=UPI0009768068|nr:AAA family ATPase [Frankia sp. CcI49]ONH56275.1 hypothetical protein CcI49_27920 [Frankia sp. CcI49]